MPVIFVKKKRNIVKLGIIIIVMEIFYNPQIKNQLAMNLGETFLVTENGNERLGNQKLDLVIL